MVFAALFDLGMVSGRGGKGDGGFTAVRTRQSSVVR